MKKEIILAAALMVSALASSQPDHYDQNHWRHRFQNRPDEKVQRLDSVIGVIRENETGLDVPDYVFIYDYDLKKDYPKEVTRLDLPERANSNRQLYLYTPDGFKSRYLYQVWDGSNWKDFMLTEYTPDEEGRLGREVFSLLEESVNWVPYQQHFYEYDDMGRISYYLRQMSDGAGGWYDFSENIWTFNDVDQLITRMEKRTADDYVIWTETYYYGEGVKPTERIRQTIRYDAVTRQNSLTNDTRQLYYYDEFNDPTVMEQYKWLNNRWEYTGKSLYYYSFIPGRKVTLCHNGHTITVAPQAVKAHLAHGDTLGACEENQGDDQWSPGSNHDNNTCAAKVYPNPARDYFEVTLPPEHSYNTAILFSGDGRVVRSKSITSLERVTFDVGGLRSGQYILKLAGPSSSEDLIIIIK